MKNFNEYFDSVSEKLGISHIRGSWEDQWIDSSDVRLYAPVFPASEPGPSVVFIPGTSVYALCYAELLYGLQQEGFNVVGFDPRGQGRSGGRRGDYTIMEHVSDARAACAYARNRFKGPVFVMGSSQGGIEAFYLAATEEKLSGVICHNIADLMDEESIRLTRFGPRKSGNQQGSISKLVFRSARAGIVMLKLAAKLAPNIKVPIVLYLDLKSEPMRAFGNAWNFILQDPLALKSISLRAMASLAGTTMPKPAGEIKTPIMVLHSSLDHIFPQDYIMRLFDMLACDKDIKIYPGLHHLITIEHVPVIIKDIVEWMKGKI